MRFCWFAISALWLLGSAGAESSLLVPRNSYLIRPVAGAKDLAHQIRTEPVVAQRYARHFGRNANELADYFEKYLQLTRLERSGTYNVYYSPPDNRLMVERKVLPKGTPVFVEKRTGKPVLKANCGNPLTPAVSIPQQPPRVETTPPRIVEAVSPIMVESEPSTVAPLGIELVEVPLEEVVASDVLPTELLAETLPELEPEPYAPLAEPLSTPETPAAPILRTAQPPWWLLLLPALGFAVGKGVDTGPPIPEPTSIVGLSAGLLLLYPYSRRVLRRSQKASQRGSVSKTPSA